jgi:hypothetical protein
MARCPAHQDDTPSLAIREGNHGRLLVKCHAGCRQVDVINALRQRGLWGGKRDDACGRVTPRSWRSSAEDATQSARRTSLALAIWEESAPADGTLVERYLASRGIRIPPPSSIRFHPRLKHRSGRRWPAMIALVTNGTTGDAIGIHRTYLRPDGAGKAPLVPAKMMLGPCRGGVVRLGDSRGKLLIGEGIETCLSAMQATGIPTWSALSTSGLRALDLPAEIHEVIVLADGDDPGEAAARDCTRRWRREGRSVRIARPPRGLDFNDLLAEGVLQTRWST